LNAGSGRGLGSPLARLLQEPGRRPSAGAVHAAARRAGPGCGAAWRGRNGVAGASAGMRVERGLRSRPRVAADAAPTGWGLGSPL